MRRSGLSKGGMQSANAHGHHIIQHRHGQQRVRNGALGVELAYDCGLMCLAS